MQMIKVPVMQGDVSHIYVRADHIESVICYRNESVRFEGIDKTISYPVGIKMKNEDKPWAIEHSSNGAREKYTAQLLAIINQEVTAHED
jgi:hypothetical protein